MAVSSRRRYCRRSFIGLSEQIGAFLRLKFSEEREEASIPGEKAGLGRCRRFPGGIHILCECLGDDALFLRQVVIFAVILQVVSERAGGQGDGEPECLPLENAVDALQPQTDRSRKQHAEPAPDQQLAAAVLKIGNADLIRYLAVGENRNQTHHAQNIFKIVQLQEIEAPGILFFDIFLIDGDEAASVEGILPVDAKETPRWPSDGRRSVPAAFSGADIPDRCPCAPDWQRMQRDDDDGSASRERGDRNACR